MSKGLKELKRLPKAIKDTFKDSFDIIEKELKEREQYKAIEEDLGVELSLFFKIMKAQTLQWKDKNKKLTHNIASEFISVKPYWSIGAGIVFEFSWNDRNISAYENCDVIIKEKESPIGMPHIYLYLKASEYGKTWALTKKELK